MDRYAHLKKTIDDHPTYKSPLEPYDGWEPKPIDTVGGVIVLVGVAMIVLAGGLAWFGYYG